MSEYKRLTPRGKRLDETNSDTCSIINRLAELEDKIEAGTLVDVENASCDICDLRDSARLLFDGWNDIAGAFPDRTGYYIECLAVIDDIIGLCYWKALHKARAETRLAELKGGKE